MASRPKPPPAPVSDEAWDRRSLEGHEPDDGKVRHNLRQLSEVAPVLLEVAESRERWRIFRSIATRFIVVTAALIAALTAFKDDILSLLKGGGQ